MRGHAGSTMLSGPSQVFEFVCQQTGRCCRSRWKVELTHYDRVALVAKARGTPLEAAVAAGVIADDGPADPTAAVEDYERTYHLTKCADGCSFLDGNRCSLHAGLGAEALPDPCRNFPVIAVATAWGTEVGYNLTCPHAIALTARSPFRIERNDDWERPLDPQQTRASMIPPPEGWRAFRAARSSAIAALANEGEADLMARVAAAMRAVVPGAWSAESTAAWCDALALEARIAESVGEAAPFLRTWGEPLAAAPAWSKIGEGLTAVLALDQREALARYLQHTLHTIYFRTGLPAARAYPFALAAFAAAARMVPALALAYPRGPLEAAIVLVEMGLFGDLRSLAALTLPPSAPPNRL